MRRVPPVMAIVLIAVWLLLNNSFAPHAILLGALLAVLMLLFVYRLRPVQPRLRRPAVVVGLVARVLVDVVRSNIGVGRVILGLAGRREIHSGFIRVPLELRDPHGLAALAMIITCTPGTVWTELSADNVLTVHVLDLIDEAQWVRAIKHRYERPLREIFE